MSKKKKIKVKSKTEQPVQKVAGATLKIDSNFWKWLIPVMLLTGVAFFPMLSNGFTNWDDDIYVTGNPLLAGPDWKAIFTQASASNYHPLTMATLAFNYAISGDEPFSYHFVNWLLHILNTALVFLFVYKISGKKIFAAALVALIFAVHPMHVESVAWVSERKDVLYTLFFLLALLQYWQYLESNKRTSIIFCFVFFVLSILSKPAAVILPIVLLLLDYWKAISFKWNVLVEKIPFFILSVVFGFITVNVQSADAIAGFDTYPLWSRFFFACYTIMIYTARFFVPYPLSAFHPYPSVDNLGLSIWLSPIFIIALALLLWLKRKDRLVVFSLLFFIVNLLLVVQFVSIGLTIVSERYTYVPYIGLSFLAAMWLEKYLAANSKPIIRAVPFVIMILFAIISFQRTKVWKDGDTLWADVIKTYPDAATPRSNHANYLKSMAAMPENKLQEAALLQKALEQCNEAIRLKPTHIKAYENRQNIYLILRKDSLAMKDADRLLQMQPSNAAAHYTKGFAYMRFNMPDSSLVWFNKSIAIDPTADWMYDGRGSLLFDSFKRYKDALADFSTAIALNPKAEYFYKRSNCYFRLGDTANAKADAGMAMQKGYNLPQAYKTALQL